MKKTVLNRYERMGDGRIVIDVSVGALHDLYENFDLTVPYVKKDLDLDFAEYLIDCAREIGNHDFVIRINLPKPEGPALMERVQRSVPSYFIYLREHEIREIKAMFRKSLILFAFGFALVSYCAVLANRTYAQNPGVGATILREGLTIAAWVSLWQAVAYVMLEWHPHRQNIRIFRKIGEAPVIFRVHTDDMKPTATP